MALCECGKCGLEVKPGQRFIHGHNSRGLKRSDETKKRMSESQIGREFSEEHKNNLSEAAKIRFQDPAEIERMSKVHIGQVSGMKGKSHSEETKIRMSESSKGQVPWMKGKSHSDVTKKKISDAGIGRKVSDETRRNLSEAAKNSEAVFAAADVMRGGYDIVDHHMIYDHSDLSKHTIPMTRSMHQRLHKLFQKHGIRIPNINMEA